MPLQLLNKNIGVVEHIAHHDINRDHDNQPQAHPGDKLPDLLVNGVNEGCQLFQNRHDQRLQLDFLGDQIMVSLFGYRTPAPDSILKAIKSLMNLHRLGIFTGLLGTNLQGHLA